MELNRDEIIKGLEICANDGDCKECPINPHKGNYGYCTSLAIKDALALIKELTEENANWEAIAEGYRKQFEDCAEERGKLTEENERLKTELRKTTQKLKAVEEVNEKLTADNEWLKRPRYKVHPDGKIEMIPTIESVRADTVRKMHSMLCEGRVSNDTVVIVANQIAKEMLEGENSQK